MRVGVGRLSAPTRPASSQRFSMNLWLPSPWITPSFGRTDHSPLRTGRDTYRIIRLSGFLVSLTLAYFASVLDNGQDRFGSSHLAYLSVLSMGNLPHIAVGLLSLLCACVDGFPVRRLLLRLRH